MEIAFYDNLVHSKWRSSIVAAFCPTAARIFLGAMIKGYNVIFVTLFSYSLNPPKEDFQCF